MCGRWCSEILFYSLGGKGVQKMYVSHSGEGVGGRKPTQATKQQKLYYQYLFVCVFQGKLDLSAFFVRHSRILLSRRESKCGRMVSVWEWEGAGSGMNWKNLNFCSVIDENSS